MKLFSSGISISTEEKKYLDHIVSDVEAWLTSSLTSKTARRKKALTEAWADAYNASSTAIPSTEKAFIDSIATQAGYKTRKASDAAIGQIQDEDEYPATSGDVKLFSSGIVIDDTDAKALLSFTPDMTQWVRRAISQKINRAKKILKKEWKDRLLDAEDYTDDLPNTPTEWINVVTARDDYERRLES